jgi:hypothetical protein
LFVGDRGTDDVSAQVFEFFTLMRTTAHSAIHTEPVRVGAQGRRGFLVPADHGA